MNNAPHPAIQSRWTWLALVAALVAWGLTDVRNRGRIDPADPANPQVHKSDLTVYTEASKAFFDGRNPYTVANPRGWHYLYPPLFAIVLEPLAQFGSQTQVVIWYFLNLLVVWGCYRESRRILALLPGSTELDRTEVRSDRQAKPAAWIAWLAAATVAMPVLNTLQRGQVGVLVLYALLLGLRLTIGSRSWVGAALGGIVLAAAINLKLTPALPALALVAICGVIAIRSGWSNVWTQRAAGLIAGHGLGLVLFFLLLPAAIIGWTANLHHLHTWIDRVVFNHDLGGENDLSYRSVRNQSLTNAVYRAGNLVAFLLGNGPDDQPEPATATIHTVAPSKTMPMDHPAAQAALKVARLGLLVLLLAAGWRLAALGTVFDVATAFGLACAATLLISPLSWAHHYTVLLPALLTAPLWQLSNGRPRLALNLAIAAFSLLAIHYALLDWAGRAGLLGIGTAVWFVVAAATMLKKPASGIGQIDLNENRGHHSVARRAA